MQQVSSGTQWGSAYDDGMMMKMVPLWGGSVPRATCAEVETRAVGSEGDIFGSSAAISLFFFWL